MLSRQYKTMNFPVSRDNIERQNQKLTWRRPSHSRKTRASDTRVVIQRRSN